MGKTTTGLPLPSKHDPDSPPLSSGREAVIV
jgi:hypothetical protein